MKEGKMYSYLCGCMSITPRKRNEYIYAIYEYDCNAITKNAMKNKSDKEMIRDFI